MQPVNNVSNHHPWKSEVCSSRFGGSNSDLQGTSSHRKNREGQGVHDDSHGKVYKSRPQHMWWKHLLFTSRVIKGINGNNRGEHGRLIGTMVIHTSIVSIAEPKTPKKTPLYLTCRFVPSTARQTRSHCLRFNSLTFSTPMVVCFDLLVSKE